MRGFGKHDERHGLTEPPLFKTWVFVIGEKTINTLVLR